MNSQPLLGASSLPARTLYTAVLLCFLAALCEGIDLQAAGVASAGIRPEFMLTNAQFTYFFTASTAGLTLGALLGGWLSDRIGRKAVLVASITLFGLLSLLTPLATGIDSLVTARALTGLGLGGALPNLIALVNESSREDRRSANVALVYSGAPLGGALASLISLLSVPAHWRLIFIAGGVAPLLVAPIMFWLLPESAAFRTLRAARATAAQPGPAERGGKFLALFGEGRALRTVLLWVSFFLALLTLYLLLNWLPTLLAANGMSKPQAAAAQIAFNIGGALSALLIGCLLEGPLRRASAVVTFVALPLLLLTLARTPAQFAPVVMIVTLLGCAVLSAQTILYALAPGIYPTWVRGTGVGAAVGVGRTGSVAGPVLAGVLFGAGHIGAQVLTDILPIVAIGGACAIVLVWLLPRNDPTQRFADRN